MNQKGISYQLKDIKENPPSERELQSWVTRYQISPRKLFNTSGLVYKELGLKEKLEAMTEKEQIHLLASNGMLIKRPLVILEDAILIGFQEEKWGNIHA